MSYLSILITIVGIIYKLPTPTNLLKCRTTWNITLFNQTRQTARLHRSLRFIVRIRWGVEARRNTWQRQHIISSTRKLFNTQIPHNVVHWNWSKIILEGSSYGYGELSEADEIDHLLGTAERFPIVIELSNTTEFHSFKSWLLPPPTLFWISRGKSG